MSTRPAVIDMNREDFISAMALAVSGVGVVATDGPAGRFGLTVSSIASVSADPPLVLACVNRTSVAHAALMENGVFSVNLLSADQQLLADAFAGRPPNGRAYDFEAGMWHASRTGAPRLKAAIASFDCVLAQAHDAGSHTVFIGRVTGVEARTGEPLLYTARAYGRPLRWTLNGGASNTTDGPRRTTAA